MKDIHIHQIINTLSIPDVYKDKLWESYSEALILKTIIKYPLSDDEVKKCAENKEEILNFISKKYPAILTDEALKEEIEELKRKYLNMLLAIASKTDLDNIEKLVS